MALEVEQEEVRSLLSRHKSRIEIELQQSNLLDVLVRKSVITSSEENLLKASSTSSSLKLSENENCSINNTTTTTETTATTKVNDNDDDCCSDAVVDINLKKDTTATTTTATSKTSTVKTAITTNNDSYSSKEQCIKLIDLIAENGFEKFKNFCFAIENECPQLIDDLINDRFKKDEAEEKENQIDNNTGGINNEKEKTDIEEPTTDSSININYLEYINSNLSSTPYSSESYGDGIISSTTATTTNSSSTISPKFQHSPVNYNQILQNVQNCSTTTTETISTNNTNSNTNTNNYSSSLRKKLFHRFSDAATMGRKLKKKKNSDRSCYSMSDTIEIFADPVIEDDGERSSWEYHTVIVTRVPGYGFGIAVSGGRDNPHFANGDPSIAVSDVLKGGPAEDRLQVNDRIVSVNGVSLENVEYATAVQVLRDSGNTVTLVVKRRVTNPIPIPPHQHPQITNNTVGGTVGMINNPTASMVPVIGLQSSCNQGQPIRVTLTKSSKKDDFGIVLGCRLFIREISAKTRDQLIANGYSLNEGDIITRVHNTNCNDSMSLKEAKKIIDGCKERLNLVVLRDITNQNLITTNNLNNLSNVQSTGYSHTQQPLACNNNLDDPYVSGVRYSSQNLYVQPPTRGGSISTPNDEKSNLTPRGRSRVPLMDVSLSQLDRPSTPLNDGSLRRSDEPPRPPPPRGEDYYSCRRQLYEDDPLQRSRQSAEPRFISFQKEGSVGIRLTGGNEAGIFVTAVQPGSPASLQGLTPGDKILKVNDMDMHGVTREEAVLFLLSLQDRIDLIVQYCKDEYEEVVANQRGDSFHIKTHFHCDNPSKGEMAFKAGDVFRVIDTLHNGVVGSWQVLKIGRGHQEMQRGVIPNKSRAEELATAQFNATKKELNTSESRGNFFKRRRTHRRSKSLSKENWDDVVFSDSISKFPAYERVVLRHPGFVRPVVLFGPVSDIAREKLTKDFPDKFTVPLQDDDKSGTKSRIVRLSNIRDIMDRGKHALLDITPNAVDRLNYAQFYPIVIFLKADTKHIIKQLRQNLPKSVHKSSKKLFEQCQKLEKVWSHIFSTTIMLHDTDSWYRKLREAIDLQQSGAVWMSESKPVESLSDDFLFPMSTTSRLSYASSPESDLELSPGPSASLSLGNLPQLVKSSSDPSIATNQDNADRDRDIVGDGLPPPYTHHFDHPNSAHSRLQASLMENKYSFPTNTAVVNQNHSTSGTIQDVTANSVHRIPSIYGMNPPDLPPRIDRASKPLIPPSTAVTNSTLANNQLSNIQSGQLNNNNRSAQDNIYGSSSGGGGGSGSGSGIGGGGGGVVKHLNSVIGDDLQNDYHSRHTDSIERTQNSLERQRIVGQIQGTPNKSTGSGAIPQSATSTTSASAATATATAAMNPQQQNGYDSVSSYESYNTTQLSVQNIRLGPNAPDDLKSVPTASARHLSSSATVSNTCDYRSPHDHNLRGFSGINDLNVQNSPGRPSIHDINSGRNIDTRNSSNLQQGLNVSQRPTNLNLDNSPRKHVLETKTDYGKYSRSNSASQADYSKSMKSHSIHSQSHNLGVINGTGSGNNSGSTHNNNMNNSNSNSNNNNNSSNNSNIPFKPVPPPKPKNYRAPIQGQINAGHWENGEQSPRSPNGFFYPPTPAAHYHHSQTNSGSSLHNTNSIINNGPQNLNYSHCSPGHISHPPPPPPSNGYKNNQHYNSPYAHRGHPSLSNLPIHSPERQALDLAGSREQRGSAFELYRKPQVGNVGHHHNVRDMESNDHRRYYRQYLQNSPQHHQHQQQQQQYQNYQNHQYQHQQHQQQEHMMPERFGGMMHCQQLNEMNDFNYRYYKKYYETPPPPPLPPPLPMKKEKKKSVLKNPFTAFKNAILKKTRPLRRMSSMVEPEKKLKPCLRRQYSLMEHRSNGRAYPCPLPPPPTSSLPLSNDKYSSHFPPSSPSSEQSSSNFNLNPNSDSFYPPDDMNSTYRSLKSVDIYKSSRIDYPHRTQQDFDDLYANRALIDLERRQAESKSGGRRIIRRHSMAERSTANSHHHSRYHHDHQQGMSPYDHDGDDSDMCRNYPDSLSLNEKRAPGSEIMMRRRFNSSNNEPIYKSRMEMHRNHLYQSRKEMQERIAQGKREMEREFSNSKLTSGNGAMLDEDHHQIYKSKAEMQENNFRIKSPTQLKEHIYQSRRDAMESMAEPTNISRRAMMTHEPIYETREECVISSKENVTDEKKEEKHEISADGTLTSDSKQSECSNETVIENQKITTENNCCNETNLDPDTSNTTTAATMAMATTTEVYKTPFHISNILKRTAPLPSPDTNASSTSIETHYTSQNSLPVEPPNATSTPYQSDTYLPNSNTASNTTTTATAAAAVESLIRTTTTTPPRESSTTKGIFDETGGTLIDNIWNVSLHIPPGAIPSGVKQEIYFTVSDPRISQMVRGPPLDMENGETMLSPLVMCGPQGLEFLIPVTLNIPHCAGKTTSLGLSLKATDSEKSLHTNWDNIELPSNTAAHTVSVKVDHF